MASRVRTIFFGERRGVTLTEVLIIIAILGTLFLLSRVGIQLLTTMMQASAVARVQQEAQTALYEITKDVRNSVGIIQASSTTLRLSMITTSQGYDVTSNSQLFSVVNISTLTYRFESSAGSTCLRKILAKDNVVLDDKKLLKNLLLTPDATNYMFNVCDRGGILMDLCPPEGTIGHPTDPQQYYGVDIRFSMSPLFVKDNNVVYSAKEIRRSNLQ